MLMANLVLLAPQVKMVALVHLVLLVQEVNLV